MNFTGGLPESLAQGLYNRKTLSRWTGRIDRERKDGKVYTVIVVIVKVIVKVIVVIIVIVVVIAIVVVIVIVMVMVIVRVVAKVGFHNFKSQNFKLSVSNPKNKYVAYVSVLSQISNCQGLGRKNKH